MHTETHEATIRAWFSTETMPAAWIAAEPAACAELAQLLRDKVLKAYQMGLLDGAARRATLHDQAIMDASDALGDCLCCLLEAKYVAQTINYEFTPLWHGDNLDARKGADFIQKMCVASSLVVEKAAAALRSLHEAQNAIETKQAVKESSAA